MASAPNPSPLPEANVVPLDTHLDDFVLEDLRDDQFHKVFGKTNLFKEKGRDGILSLIHDYTENTISRQELAHTYHVPAKKVQEILALQPKAPKNLEAIASYYSISPTTVFDIIEQTKMGFSIDSLTKLHKVKKTTLERIQQDHKQYENYLSQISQQLGGIKGSTIEAVWSSQYSTIDDLAKKYGVSSSSVSRIINKAAQLDQSIIRRSEAQRDATKHMQMAIDFCQRGFSLADVAQQYGYSERGTKVRIRHVLDHYKFDGHTLFPKQQIQALKDIVNHSYIQKTEAMNIAFGNKPLNHQHLSKDAFFQILSPHERVEVALLYLEKQHYYSIPFEDWSFIESTYGINEEKAHYVVSQLGGTPFKREEVPAQILNSSASKNRQNLLAMIDRHGYFPTLHQGETLTFEHSCIEHARKDSRQIPLSESQTNATVLDVIKKDWEYIKKPVMAASRYAAAAVFLGVASFGAYLGLSHLAKTKSFAAPIEVTAQQQKPTIPKIVFFDSLAEPSTPIKDFGQRESYR